MGDIEVDFTRRRCSHVVSAQEQSHVAFTSGTRAPEVALAAGLSGVFGFAGPQHGAGVRARHAFRVEQLEKKREKPVRLVSESSSNWYWVCGPRGVALCVATDLLRGDQMESHGDKKQEQRRKMQVKVQAQRFMKTDLG